MKEKPIHMYSAQWVYDTINIRTSKFKLFNNKLGDPKLRGIRAGLVLLFSRVCFIFQGSIFPQYPVSFVTINLISLLRKTLTKARLHLAVSALGLIGETQKQAMSAGHQRAFWRASLCTSIKQMSGQNRRQQGKERDRKERGWAVQLWISSVQSDSRGT